MGCSQLPSVHLCHSFLPSQGHPWIMGRKKKEKGSINTQSKGLGVGTTCKVENILSYPPSVRSNFSLGEEEHMKSDTACILPVPPAPSLRTKPIPASLDRDQSLQGETGFAMPLEIPPQVHNYTLIGLLSFPITATLSSVHQKGVWLLPSTQPLISSLLSHLLSFQPWDTLDNGEKKKSLC